MEKVMKQHDDVDFQLRFLPYQLLAEQDEEPKERLSSLLETISKRMPGMTMDDVKGMGQAINLEFEAEGSKYLLPPEGEIFIANSREAHRVIYLAGKKGGVEKQAAAKEFLFRGYFEEGRPPNEKDLLRGAAEVAGLNPDVVNDRRAGSAELDEEFKEAREIVEKGLGEDDKEDNGIARGVPLFVLRADGKANKLLSSAKEEDLSAALAEMAGKEPAPPAETLTEEAAGA